MFIFSQLQTFSVGYVFCTRASTLFTSEVILKLGSKVYVHKVFKAGSGFVKGHIFVPEVLEELFGFSRDIKIKNKNNVGSKGSLLNTVTGAPSINS